MKNRPSMVRRNLTTYNKSKPSKLFIISLVIIFLALSTLTLSYFLVLTLNKNADLNQQIVKQNETYYLQKKDLVILENDNYKLSVANDNLEKQLLYFNRKMYNQRLNTKQ